MARSVIPLVIFGLLVAVLYKGLYLDPREIPSPLIGKPAPEFSLPRLNDPQAQFSKQMLLGKVTLVNAWASWCITCRDEHQLLLSLAKEGVPIYGINYKDTREDAQTYLNQLGNPYVMNGHDFTGRVGIDWGVVATPESFLVDKKGIIRYKQPGAITPEVWAKSIAPLIAKLNQEPG
ncbi:MAG: DsbE family thiol:disulfide interchange protein [Gammaproteobacteria bacterium]|nr:DsbE family thiol:disulfide interchange protein [Gammaproteobacteria bacterium]